MTRLAVFDCDGTLVDSAADICLAMEEAFAAHRLAVPSREATRRVVGLSLVEAIARLDPQVDGERCAALADTYKRAFHRLRGEGRVCEPLFPGVRQALAALAADGWLLGVATGKSDRGLRLCLERHGIADRFVTLQTADRHPSKPHPSMVLTAMAEAGAMPEDTVVIGDTSFDMAMARAAGARAIGVAWGYHERDELLAEGADLVAEAAADLPQLMKEVA